VTVGSPQIEELRAQARYHRERYDLYRAKMYALRPTTLARLRQLERAHHAADARLRALTGSPASSGPPASAPGGRFERERPAGTRDS
jgi:hypothetical protein